VEFESAIFAVVLRDSTTVSDRCLSFYKSELTYRECALNTGFISMNIRDLGGLKVNKKILIAIIVIVAISIVGTAALYALSANDGMFEFSGTMVFQSDVTGVSIAILGPEETLKTGAIGDSGELTFTGLPEGDYQAIAVKEGYTSHHVMGTSINRGYMGGKTTVPISMMAMPDEMPLYVSANPNAVIIKQGSSKYVTVTVTSMNDVVDEVSLDCTQLPSGVTAAFSPASVTLTAGGKASSTLTLTVSSTAAKGIYGVDIELNTEELGTGGFALLFEVS